MLWGTEETFFLVVNYEYHFELYYCTKLYKVIQANICRDMRGAFQTLSEIGEIGVLYQKCLIN